MPSSQPSREPTVPRYRPSSVSVFAAAFVAGAVVAFGLNRMLDTHLAQSRPQVESVPIFVALRSLPQGAPVTVWDVALRDWPKAMLPTTALGAEDSFDGMILKHPLREGQPLLSVQLMRSEAQATADPQPREVFNSPAPAAAAVTRQPEPDLWTPAASPTAQVVAPQPTVATSPAEQPPLVQSEAQAAEQLPTVAIAASPVEDASPVADGVAVADPAPVAAPIAAPASPETPIEPDAGTLVSDEVSEAVIEDAPPQPTLAQPTLAESVAPVPASPLIDIEQSLKAVSTRSPTFTEAPYAGPTVAESVLTAGSPAAQPTDGAATPPLRYLVVPERIAVEADASFAAPPAAVTPPVAAAARSQQPSAKQPTAKQPQGQKTATTPPSQRPLGAFFPNMAAGLDALSGSRSGQSPQPTRSR